MTTNLTWPTNWIFPGQNSELLGVFSLFSKRGLFICVPKSAAEWTWYIFGHYTSGNASLITETCLQFLHNVYDHPAITPPARSGRVLSTVFLVCEKPRAWSTVNGALYRHRHTLSSWRFKKSFVPDWPPWQVPPMGFYIYFEQHQTGQHTHTHTYIIEN